VRRFTPRAAADAGIGIVFQELSLFPHRSVLANLFANAEPTRFGLVHLPPMRERAAAVLAQVGLSADLDAPVKDLPINEQQLVEIARVLLRRPRVLILDEPNSALNEGETHRLFATLRQLSATGITQLYVSHRLEEVFAISDRITVVRNGETVATADTADLTIERVVRHMIGESRRSLYPDVVSSRTTTSRSLQVDRLTVARRLVGASFTAYEGEVVGLAGLEGSGIDALIGVLFGVLKAESGAVTFPDGQGPARSPREAARRGIGLVPADRKNQGLMLDKSVGDNLVQVTVATDRWWRIALRRREHAAATDRARRLLNLKADSAASQVTQLSGGNQQKVVIGKWLEVRPQVMLLDDPARGVDVGAKRDLFDVIRSLAADGKTVLYRSTELSELIGVCDRIVVFYRGRIAGEAPATAFNHASLLHAINTAEMPSGGDGG
jgi:ABC-type sugar transport system ATPase subunit